MKLVGSNGYYNNHSHDKNDGMILCEWHCKIMATLIIFLLFFFCWNYHNNCLQSAILKFFWQPHNFFAKATFLFKLSNCFMLSLINIPHFYDKYISHCFKFSIQHQSQHLRKGDSSSFHTLHNANFFTPHHLKHKNLITPSVFHNWLPFI